MQGFSSGDVVRREYLSGLFGTIMLLLVGIVSAPSLWIWPVAAGIAIIQYVIFRPGIIRLVIILALTAAVILVSAILLFMIRDDLQEPVFTGEETLIIPGAAVDGTRPGLFLNERLEGALVILESYSEMAVIVTGYQAPGSQMSEAAVMKNYLTGRGIREDRIFIEERASDTIRNFENSALLIEEEGLSNDVIIVTHDFHAFRSSWLAKKNGLDPVSSPVDTPLKSLFLSLLKEAGSLIKVQLYYAL